MLKSVGCALSLAKQKRTRTYQPVLASPVHKASRLAELRRRPSRLPERDTFPPGGIRAHPAAAPPLPLGQGLGARRCGLARRCGERLRRPEVRCCREGARTVVERLCVMSEFAHAVGCRLHVACCRSRVVVVVVVVIGCELGPWRGCVSRPSSHSRRLPCRRLRAGAWGRASCPSSRASFA